MKPKQAPKPNKPTKSPAPTQTPAPAADPAAERQQQLESARRKLNDLMGYSGSFARAERGLTVAKAMLLAAEAAMKYRQDQLIAMAQGSAQPEAPWLKAIADSPLGRSFPQEYSRVGATDDDLIELFVKFVENGDARGGRRGLRRDLACGDYQFDLAADHETPMLMLASGRHDSDAIATGDEIIADIREALKIPQPRSSPTKPGQTKPGKAPKSPAPVEAPKPAASKPKPIRKVDKSAEMAALAKAAKAAGSSKPPRLTYADYQYKLAWRADGHTRSKVTSPGQFDRTSEDRDDAIRHLLAAAKLPPTTVVDDRTGITSEAVESPTTPLNDSATPATDSTTTATDPIAPATRISTPRVYEKDGLWFLEDATGKITGLRKAIDAASAFTCAAAELGCHPGILYGPDGLQGSMSAYYPVQATDDARDDARAQRMRNLSLGAFYLFAEDGGWHAGEMDFDGIDRRPVGPCDTMEVEDAIRAACVLLDIDPRDLAVLDDEGNPLDGTAADLLKAEESLPD